MSARIGRTVSTGVPRAPALPPDPRSSVRRRSRPVRARWHCRPYDQFCIVPGTSAPRSTSSRSVTVTVLHQPPERHGVLVVPGVALEPFAPGAPHVSETPRVGLARPQRPLGALRLGIGGPFLKRHRPRAPGVAALRREAIETVFGAGGKSASLGVEAAALIPVVFMVSGRWTALRGWECVPGAR